MEFQKLPLWPAYRRLHPKENMRTSSRALLSFRSTEVLLLNLTCLRDRQIPEEGFHDESDENVFLLSPDLLEILYKMSGVLYIAVH